MVSEVMDLLRPKAGMTVVDGTTGTGGHAIRLAEEIGDGGFLLCVDRDPELLEIAKSRMDEALRNHGPERKYMACSHAEIGDALRASGRAGADAVLLDLGVNSLHLDDAARGFSFSKDGPLDGRFDRRPGSGPTIADLVNTASERDLAGWIHRHGDERHARRMARRIVSRRKERPFETTLELASIAWDVYPPKERHGRIHPATRLFQALRIAANDELGHVERGVAACMDVLNPAGRLAVITFHSGEDRIVKRLFRAASGPRPDPSNLYSATTMEGVAFRQPVRSAIGCTAEEAARNPRARSAKLRVIERLGEVAA